MHATVVRVGFAFDVAEPFQPGERGRQRRRPDLHVLGEFRGGDAVTAVEVREQEASRALNACALLRARTCSTWQAR